MLKISIFTLQLSLNSATFESTSAGEEVDFYACYALAIHPHLFLRTGEKNHRDTVKKNSQLRLLIGAAKRKPKQ
jgi:hypothetical protein